MDENKVEAVEEKTVTPEAAAAPETADQAPRGNRRDNRGRGPRRNNPRFAREQKEFEERVVKISRVSKTVKGGRKMRFSALVVIGDRKGRVGYGLGKANEVPDAIRKALDDARKNVVRVPLVNGNRTIPHTVIGTYGAGEVILRPAAEGTGVVAGGTVRAVMELAGVTDVLGKCLGSRTPINAVRATMEAIAQLKTVNSVAKMREKKVEEIR